MAAVRFTLGQSDNVRFNLPSRRRGDPDTLVGKVAIEVHSLKCSLDVHFRRSEMRRFLHDLESAADNLRGTFSITATYGQFGLRGEMSPHGRARLHVLFASHAHPQKDDPHWSTEATFSCPAESLRRAVEQAGSVE